MTVPEVGTKLTYTGTDALGLAARIADPAVSDDDSYDSPALDLAPGTQVEVTGYDEDRDLTIVEWTDTDGNARCTSIDSLNGWTEG